MVIKILLFCKCEISAAYWSYKHKKNTCTKCSGRVY